MASENTDPRKQELFISALLGFMIGVGAFLLFKAVTTDRLILLVVLLPMFLTSFPLVQTLKELRRARNSRAQ